MAVLPRQRPPIDLLAPQHLQSFASTAAQNKNRRIISRDDPISKFMPKNLQIASSVCVTDLSARRRDNKFLINTHVV
jgi:hypothetical protein